MLPSPCITKTKTQKNEKTITINTHPIALFSSRYDSLAHHIVSYLGREVLLSVIGDRLSDGGVGWR